MDEYINRKQAVDIAESYGLNKGYAAGRHSGIADRIAESISIMPAAAVASVRHGRWIAIKVPNEWDKGQCSECRSIFNSSVWGTDYCPSCGARMDLDDDA